jgi:hypothetical protein
VSEALLNVEALLDDVEARLKRADRALESADLRAVSVDLGAQLSGAVLARRVSAREIALACAGARQRGGHREHGGHDR